MNRNQAAGQVKPIYIYAAFTLLLVVLGMFMVIFTARQVRQMAILLTAVPTPVLLPSWLPTANLTPTATIDPRLGDWEYHSSTSGLDDVTNTFVGLYADKSDQDTYGRPNLIVRCQASVLDIYLETKRMLNSGGGDYPLKYRFDTGSLTTTTAGLGHTGTSLFFNNPRVILGQLASASKLTVGYTTGTGSVVELSFDVRGFSFAAKDIKAQCSV